MRSTMEPANMAELKHVGDSFGVTDEAMLDYARVADNTLHHVVGMCRMSTAPLAAVDLVLRLNEVEALRVVEASTSPRIS